MPTPDERIATLEFNLRQFKTETVKAYTELAYELTIIKGLGEDSIKRLAALHREMHERVGLIDERLNQVYDEINAHTLLLHQILDRLPAKEE